MTFSYAHSRYSVLVVDDDPKVLGVMDEKLSQAGYIVLLAQSGTMALEVMKNTAPDIVLVDAIMPEMTGWEVCAQIKQDLHFHTTPVIFMTGMTETEYVLKAFEAGAADYITKPFKFEEVLARVAVRLEAASRINAAHSTLDKFGRFLFGTTQEGVLLWATPQASEALDKLPKGTIQDLSSAVKTAENGTKLFSYQTPKEEYRITFVGRPAADEMIFSISTHNSHPEKIIQEKLSLSSREAEVILWISRGKSSRDIADILDISPRTVDKHIEQIYNKTGLSSRAAAASTVSRLLQEL
ncbi:LuxR family two component transcriptional regulator [Zymomonas mobilis]|uniref:LuxR family two component transcriptional regulator n=1 Tax=Zymomonas mobilis TaxID=542 RepID=A0A542W2I2_ZYMMB|nr:response regulator [Zymomonas mobilis]TQL17792.1 LuxR family two component transcriptional regulator [Zymomonas mobilis]